MRSPYSLHIVRALSRLGALECGFVIFGLRNWHIWKKQTALRFQSQVAREGGTLESWASFFCSSFRSHFLSFSPVLLMSSYAWSEWTLAAGGATYRGQCGPIQVSMD